MLLTYFLPILISFLSLYANADAGLAPSPILNINSGQAGKYELARNLSTLNETQLSVGLCPDFSLDKKDLTGGRPLSFGARYIFETKKSSHLVDSDINPGICKFFEINSREDKSESETQLTRMNEERCKDDRGGQVVRSKTTAVVTVTPNKIELRYEILGSEPYSCVWIRKP
jgi:hypothetical protein